MFRKILLVLSLLVIVAALAWFKRIDVMLAMVKFKSERELVVAPNREIQWQQGPQQASGERPPNIILILADDLGYNDISTFGGGVAGGRVQTPHIDQLAAEGAVFSQSYAGNATCAPSRAMIMTGRYPTRTGFEFTPTPSGMGPMVSMVGSSMKNGLPPAEFNDVGAAEAPAYELQGLPSSEVTIAEVLRERGYHTAHIGKWHLGRGKGFAPNDQGFDESLLMSSGLYLPEDDPNVVNAKLEFDPIDKFLWARMGYAASFNNTGSDSFEPGGYLTDYWTDESIAMIKANRNRPFFLYLAHWGPHTPLQATREDYEAVGDIQPHRLRVYAAMIRALDRSVGRIMATLEEQGIADNTVVVFSSDNGGAGYIGLDAVNAPFRGWKLTNFEGGLRVPLLVKWPQQIAPSTQVDTPVAHIDLMPTLAAAAGAAVPDGVVIDGRDLLPLTTPAGAADWDRQTLFWQSGYYRVVRHGDWKLQLSDKPSKAWLYDLAQDPTEQVNLAAVRADKVAELGALLDAHKASARPPLYPYVAEMPVAIDKSLADPFLEGDEYIYWPN
ncbi:sulfatase [Halieaceae bacterium IMCC14734]|uniref:Sulfatase n=1 Tax=Candidatus Litorirhabdus singularis TaxID=2518993 RepID=A0ABT3TF25_9GAMM|nr:sulfatase [Candidatus Litorirhabdus singularis]MCX2980918.1 sulfatase [Candidatus Litorirhabdus singularis]